MAGVVSAVNKATKNSNRIKTRPKVTIMHWEQCDVLVVEWVTLVVSFT